jgi:hypothetical protein
VRANDDRVFGVGDDSVDAARGNLREGNAAEEGKEHNKSTQASGNLLTHRTDSVVLRCWRGSSGRRRSGSEPL